MTKYTFVKETSTEQLPLCGTFETESSVDIEYMITATDVRLKIDSWYFSSKDLAEFIDFLTSVKNHLESN